MDINNKEHVIIRNMMIWTIWNNATKTEVENRAGRIDGTSFARDLNGPWLRSLTPTEAARVILRRLAR
jgi:hypothetical protein